MKKLLLIGAILFAFACSTSNEAEYLVNVTLSGDSTLYKSDSLVMTNYANENELIKQTVAIKDGKAEFKGHVVTPENFYIQFAGIQGSMTRLFLENEKYSVNIDLAKPRSASITGGKTQKIIDSINTLQQEIFIKNNIDSLMKVYYNKATTKEQKIQIEQLYDSVSQLVNEISNNYIDQHPTSLYALENLSNKLDEMNLSDAETAIQSFLKDSIQFKDNTKVSKIASAIAKMKTLEPGNVAPNFTQNDSTGTPIELAEIYKKNKVTMIDFWASWCGPCRAFNPTLTEIYAKYHKKGFEILGVSFDTNKNAWEKAIKDDKLVWPNVSDLQGWKNAVGEPYMVKYIPQNILVDENGIIIKRRASKEEIEEILTERLK